MYRQATSAADLVRHQSTIDAMSVTALARAATEDVQIMHLQLQCCLYISC